MLLFAASLILLVHNQVSANEVMSYTQNKGGNQLYFPWQSSGGVVADTKSIDIDSESSFGYGTFTAKCEFHDNEPVLRLYTEDGILIEAASMLGTTDKNQACAKERIQKIIVPKKPENGMIVISYLYKMGSELICFSRTYAVTKNLVMAQVERKDDRRAQCPTVQNQYLQRNSDITRSGGVGKFTEAKELFEVPYKLSQGVEIILFPQQDFKGKTFKIICGERDTDKDSTVIIGSVIHGDHNGVVLESFEMKSCSIEHINLGRRIVNKEDHFKTVFKKTDGTCEEREYKFSDEKSFEFYNRLTIDRFEPKTVPCPSSFVGDIGLNAFVPWYIRLLRIILFFWFKAVPYGVEV